jgi:hypothetical protein
MGEKRHAKIHPFTVSSPSLPSGNFRSGLANNVGTDVDEAQGETDLASVSWHTGDETGPSA